MYPRTESLIARLLSGGINYTKMHGNELHSLYSNYLCRTPDIADVETIFNVFNYDQM